MRFHGPEADRMRMRLRDELCRLPEEEAPKAERPLLAWFESAKLPCPMQISPGSVVTDAVKFRKATLVHARGNGRPAVMAMYRIQQVYDLLNPTK